MSNNSGGEIPLEDKELCNVSETLPTRCNGVQQWYEAVEYATMYCSSVSLLPTHREETNRVVARNRRIGIGIIDWTGWVYDVGLNKVTSYMRKGYEKVTKINQEANAEAGVPEAIRKTTIKKLVA
jgi:ribonucleoside-diphosphate reductase alpha chain